MVGVEFVVMQNSFIIVTLLNLDMNVGILMGLIKSVSFIYLKFWATCRLSLHCQEVIYVNSF